MSNAYRAFFGMKREPFTSDLRIEDIMETSATKAVSERAHYAVTPGAVAVISGEVGSGKSTSLRLALSNLHPSEYKPLYVTATPGSIHELYREIAWTLGQEIQSYSRARLLRIIRESVSELAEGRKIKPVLVINERLPPSPFAPGRCKTRIV